MTKIVEHSAEIIPILALADQATSIEMLQDVFGFEIEGTTDGRGTSLRLGNQSLLVVPNCKTVGAIGLHHVALAAADVDTAMTECLERGGVLASSMTPDGPQEIEEFWSGGVRYVFFEGPEGALIEFCMKKIAPQKEKWGHDYLGIECESLDTVRRYFADLGCSLVATHVLDRADGRTKVVFLQYGSSIVELFEPETRHAQTNRTPTTRWVGCSIGEVV